MPARFGAALFRHRLVHTVTNSVDRGSDINKQFTPEVNLASEWSGGSGGRGLLYQIVCHDQEQVRRLYCFDTGGHDCHNRHHHQQHC